MGSRQAVRREEFHLHLGRTFDGVDGPHVAIAHDYLTQRGGAEKVVLSMSRAFPDAAIYTLLYDRDNTYPEFANRDVRVSGLNRIWPLRKNHRAALPVLPFVASALRVDADVVLTSSSGWAHGFTTRGRKLVLCHTPARWLYMRDEYLGGGGLLKRAALTATSRYLRPWDRRAAQSCDQYLAVSTMIQRRIADVYGIEAEVLHSPVGMSTHRRSGARRRSAGLDRLGSDRAVLPVRVPVAALQERRCGGRRVRWRGPPAGRGRPRPRGCRDRADEDPTTC